MGRTKLILLVLAGAVIATSAYPLVERGLEQAFLYDALALLSVCVALVGASLQEDGENGPWQLTALAFALFFAGDVIWDIYELALDRESPVPSLADAAYIGAYVSLMLAMVSFLRRSGRRDIAGAVLDTGIVAAGTAIVCWEPLLAPVGSTGEAFVAGVYPVGDIACLALVVTLVVGRKMSVAGFLMILGFVSLMVADVSFLILDRTDSYLTGDWPDILWMLAPVVIALASIAPDTDRLREAPSTRHARMTSILLVCAGLVALPLDLVRVENLTDADNLARAALRVVFIVLIAGRLLRVSLTEAKAHEDLATTSTRLMTIVENTAVAVAYTAVDGTVLEWNAAAEKLFGVTRSEMIGTNLLDRFALRDGSTLWRDGDITQDIVPMELRGVRVVVGLRREAVQTSGKVTGYVVFATDATKEVLYEEAVQQVDRADEIAPVIERLGEVLHEAVGFDALSLYAIEEGSYRELTTLLVSEGMIRSQVGWEAFNGRPSAQTLHRMATESVIVVRNTGSSEDEINRFVRNISGLRSAIIVPLRRERAVHSALLVGFRDAGPVRPELVELVQAVAPMLSRSVRRMLVIEHERQALRQLEEIETLREHFLKMVVHEIRSPLGAVGMAAEALRDQVEHMAPQQTRDLAAGIALSVRRLDQLARDLIEVSQAETAGFPCTPSEIEDPAGLITLAAKQAVGGRLSDLVLDIDLPSSIGADRHRLEQVVTNLVGNACNYAPPGRPIEIRAWLEGREFHMSVRDHGIGIAPHEAHRLFGRFSRLTQRGVEHPVRGSGLGLYITRGIVESHGGRIWMDPTPGGGATFEVVLPQDARRDSIPVKQTADA